MNGQGRRSLTPSSDCGTHPVRFVKFSRPLVILSFYCDPHAFSLRKPTNDVLMKVYAVLFLCFSTASFLKAQVSGHVQSVGGDAVAYANVIVLLNQDSSFVRGGLTDERGNFWIEPLPAGHYRLTIRFIGFEDWYSDAFWVEEGSPWALGKVELQEATQLLEGVEVRAHKMLMEQTPEGTVINVENSIFTQGSSALELVERSPGVVLDRRNNNLTLNGQSGTLIMINGRPVRMSAEQVTQLLNGMRADNVEKIELLTNPSAKYDADGTAGIINLVLKRNDQQGTQGSVSLSAGYGWGQKETASLSLNHSTPTVNYYGTYAFAYDDTYSQWHGLGSFDNPARGGYNTFDFRNATERSEASHNVQLGVDKSLPNGTLLGTNLLYNRSAATTNVINVGEYWLQEEDFLKVQIDIRGKPRWDNMNATIFAEKPLGDHVTLHADADYVYFSSDAPTHARSKYFDEHNQRVQPEDPVYSSGNRSESRTDIHVGVAKVDLVQRLGRIQLETGLKGTYSQTTNLARLERQTGEGWQADPRTATQSDITEAIGAAYASLQYALDSSTQLTLGARYEHWNRHYGDPALDRTSGRLFPSFFLSRAVGGNHQLQLGYNRRVARPSYNDLASYLVYNDPTSVFTGNPLLRPTVSDHAKIGYQWKDLNVALIYTHETHPIVRFQLVESEAAGLTAISPQNMDYQQELGLQVNLPVSLAAWWTLNLGGQVGRRKFALSHTTQKVRHQYVAYNLYANQTLLLPAGFSMEVSGFYNGDHYYGSMKGDGFGTVNLGVKKELKENRGSFQLTVTDVFQTMQYVNRYGRLTREAFDSKTWVAFQPESGVNRIFRLSYHRSFGSNPVSRPRRGNVVGEEDNRIRKD